MKPLSDTLEAMKLSAAMPKEPQHGLTTTAGRSITALSRRARPLTQEQLTEIDSTTLQGLFSIKSKERVKYGRKPIDGFWYENEPIGMEPFLELTICFRPDCSMSMLNAALAFSPKEACVKHLNHLAEHKQFSGNDHGMAVKLYDYVEALKDIPEFVLYKVLSNYWINDPRPFIPFIAEIKEACLLVQNALERQKSIATRTLQPQPKIATPRPLTRQEKLRDEWTIEEWDEWVSAAEKMIGIAKNSNGILNHAAWVEETLKRKSERSQKKPLSTKVSA